MAKTDKIEEFNDLFINGITKGIFNHKISDPKSKGVVDLKNKLLSDENIPLKLEKIEIFMTGCYKEQKIWNKGEFYRPCFPDCKAFFAKIGKSEIYSDIIKRCKSLHIYREMPNRQGHSNEKPSYWSYGYDTLSDYFKALDENQINNYKEIHCNCCGINKGVNETKQEKRDERKNKKKEFKKSQRSSRKSSVSN